ncbi:hypothetical protein JX266_012385 [Neoarthrinium moseri]|nr:hypothetical protein JX266_012385 [Neoarthrinium moseri]
MAAIVDDVPNRAFQNVSSADSPLIFEPFDLPSSNQRRLGTPHVEGTVMPLALRPAEGPETSTATIEGAIQSIESLQAQGGLLTQKLATHGALLFRGLPIHDAEQFSKFAHAFGYRPHEIIGIVVDRPLLAPNVAPANEAPKDVLIYNHNESPQVPHAPEYVFFYCHRAPRTGGETPASSSLELFYRAQREIPEFIDEISRKGILSRVTYKIDRQHAGGSTLKQAFGKEVQEEDDEAMRRAKVEAQIARLPAVRTQPATGLPTLFTGLAAYYKSVQAGQGARRNVTQQLFGDGTPIPEKYLAHLAKITDEIRVLHRWERGDVLVFDNVIAQHGRQPWGGEQADRVVLASLFDGQVPGAYCDEDWAQVVQALDG